MTAVEHIIDLVAVSDSRVASFQRVSPLRWVGESSPHLRNILEFERLKGATFSARWGWSVDFVPILKGRKLAWKRTPLKAEFDLCIDPIDTSGSVPSWYSFTASASQDHIARVWNATIDAAEKDWRRVQSLENLLDLFHSRSVMQFRRFSLQNYAQTDLAWGLLLLATGKAEEGYRRLANFCESFEIDRSTAILQKAVAEASAVSVG